MKLFAPAYYRNFQCIADACRHSCCIGWEIDVDDVTLQKYHALPQNGYAKQVLQSIDNLPTPHFRLDQRERCPHLEENGLCRLILSLGEDCLCHICREHPRFYNDTPLGREVGLGMACEEACRLILSEERYDQIAEVGEIPGEPMQKGRFDPLHHRARVYALLSDNTLPYTQRLQQISRAYGVSPRRYSATYWQDLLSSLEYMDEEHRTWSNAYTASPVLPRETECLLERALAYFVFRHCTESASLAQWKASLGLCLVLERLLASLAAKEGAYDLAAFSDLARALSEELEYSEENTDTLRFAFL